MEKLKKELERSPKTILRFINRRGKLEGGFMQEEHHLVVGENADGKTAKSIIKKMEKNGWNLITKTDIPCPKCKIMLDNLGPFRVIGGLIELYRCEKCRFIDHKWIVQLDDSDFKKVEGVMKKGGIE